MFAIYALTLYDVASPDPNLSGGGQLPDPNECNSILTSGTRGIYLPLYIDVDERGHRLRFFHAPRRQLNPIRKNWGMIGRHQVNSKRFLGVFFTGDCKLIFHEIDYLKTKADDDLF